MSADCLRASSERRCPPVSALHPAGRVDDLINPTLKDVKLLRIDLVSFLLLAAVVVRDCLPPAAELNRGVGRGVVSPVGGAPVGHSLVGVPKRKVVGLFKLREQLF